jgi:hypothetical protein
MTQLRRKMLEELRRRNYSHRTARTYVRIVRDFAEYFQQPPDKLPSFRRIAVNGFSLCSNRLKDCLSFLAVRPDGGVHSPLG